eukprot:TRINITY_DN111821_c0_g1_i1.p1 TRINITY_DN111821_c0_g1~~TRINITY_DN111821_c0_g1_i1.p1  ORF type:complete len:328 (+),score=49.69 TRINITY_DN111821_c0_g1_i1:63-1046(+)
MALIWPADDAVTAVGTVFWTGWLLSLAIQMVAFLVAYFTQSESFYDAIGGVNYIALVVWSAAYGGGFDGDARKVVASSLFSLSRIYLLVFLCWRAGARNGDSRFEKIKPYFFRFMVAWILQAVWCFSVSTPILFINGGTSTTLSPFGGTCLVLFAIGLCVQAVSDVQKARWVSAGRPGGFCTKGLWRFSRHPNYFGEMLMAWTLWAATVDVWLSDTPLMPLGLACVLAPAITMGLLLFVSGLPLCEGAALKRYEDVPGFWEYRDNTSILVPLVGYRFLPKFVKMTILCEWPLYAYRQAAPEASDETEATDGLEASSQELSTSTADQP